MEIKPKLLVIDNDCASGAQIAAIGECCGYQTTVTHNFEDFKSEYADGASIIAIDLMMPDVDGVEILRFLTGEQCAAGILLTSSSDARVLNTAVRLGRKQRLWVIGSMQKPFAEKTLKTLLTDAEPTLLEKTRHLSVLFTPQELNDAIQQNQLAVFYQPKISLETLEFQAAEALVRWQHPRLGLLTPDKFVRLMELGGMIDPMTIAVLNQAFRQCAAWLKSGLRLKVSVNVSTRSLSDLTLPEKLLALTEKHGIDPSQIVIEITESLLSEDTLTALDVLTRLRIKGFALSIDDFGTGYSTMQQLADIPFSELKLDKSFVNGAARNQEARAIVDSTIALGHSLNLRVVAEGIENQEDWDLISNLGCDEGQGYFIARPMPADQVWRWLEHWNASLGRRAVSA